MRLALGETGATLIALGIAISALGFMSQGMLTTPRVYFAMAEDRLFFKGVATVSARTHVPVVAILLQGAAAIAIALTGSYGQIWAMWSRRVHRVGRTGGLVRLSPPRPRGGRLVQRRAAVTTAVVLACAIIVAATLWNDPKNSAIGFFILAAGIPAFLFWQSRRGSAS